MEYKKVEQKINNIVNDNVKLLAQLFPSAVKDGEVDFEALKEELGEFQEVGSEKYELTWAGKQNAKKVAQEDVYGKTLKFIPEDSLYPETTENLYIEGDNLEVLKLIRQNYYGAIKMIYIDPPYNTGNDFVYNDNFLLSKNISDLVEGSVDFEGNRYVVNQKSQNRFHANWLNMIYPRLKIAKDLLIDEGAIFISIGQDEISNMIHMCNEIFGERNQLGICSRLMKTGGNKGRFFSPNIDYILVYSKNIDLIQDFKGELDPELIKKLYNKIETEGERKGEKYRPFGLYQSSLDARPNQRYYIECPDGSFVIPPGETMPETVRDGVKIIPNFNDGCWRWSDERYMEERKKGNIIFIESPNGVLIDQYGNKAKWNVYTKIWLSDRQEDGQTPTNFISKYENRHSAKELSELGITFDFAKSSELIKYLYSLMNGNKDDIILDFFSGSASTAQAIMKMNSEDNGKRKFIMVQLPEKIKNNYTICNLGRERINCAGKKIKLNCGKEGLDIGYKTFRVDNSNIKWNLDHKNNIQMTTDIINYTPDLMDFVLDYKDVDIVYELMLRQKDVPLSALLEQLNDIGERTYFYASSYLVCLESQITRGIIDKLSELNPLPIKFIFRDSAFGDDIALKDETFRRLKALIEKNAGSSKITYTVEFI